MKPPSAANTMLIHPLGAVVALHGGLLAGVLAGILASVGFFGTPGELLTKSALMAGATWLLATWLGLGVLLLVSRRRALELGMAVLGGSVARMLGSLFVGLLVFVALSPDGRSFWTVFLGAGLGVLIAESMWAMAQLNRASATAGRVGA